MTGWSRHMEAQGDWERSNLQLGPTLGDQQLDM